MPHYSFLIPDHNFAEPFIFEVPDRVAARRRAVVHLAEILRYRPGLLGLDDTIRLQVHDATAKCLFIVNVQVIDVAAED